MLKYLQEREKDGKLDESDDDDNLILDMEEMMNIGNEKQMCVLAKGDVVESVKKSEKNGNIEEIKVDNKEKNNENEKKSIFEKGEKEKIDKAKKAIKELEMLMDKRIEMKKQKKGKNGKQIDGNDCSVITGKSRRKWK